MQNQINSLKGEVKNEIQNTMKTQQAVLMNQQNVFQTNLQNMLSGFFQNQASTSGTLPSNTIPNPKGEMKAITTRSGVAYEGPSIPTNPSPKKTLCFLMPRFAPTIRNLLMNKEKLLELAKIPLNENFSAMLLKKLPEKLGDPDKFLIPCNFPGMDVCHALADLGASINLMPLSIWKKLSLPELTPTRITLELADRSITHPKGLAEDVFVKVGKFHFPTDFVVVRFLHLRLSSSKNEDLKEVTKAKPSIEEPPELKLKDLPSHLEYAYDCIDAFETLKKKLTEAPILVVPDWNLPFELMCDASDFAIERTVGENRASWSDKLDDALWAFCTAFKTSIGYTLQLIFNTSAGNPVKKILLKLNLSDHRLCKMVVECQSVKVKEFQERCNIKAFQEWYEHVGPEVASPQGGKVTSWRRDYAWLMISRCSRSLCQIQVQGTSSNQEVNDHNNIFTRESQEYELKTRDKA
ncbi:reverse transcriptase domain-containing protein [Tanacetum coccineum]